VTAVFVSLLFDCVGAAAIFDGETTAAALALSWAGYMLGTAAAWVTDDRRADRAYWEELRRSARELSRQEALDKSTFAGWRRHGRS